MPREHAGFEPLGENEADFRKFRVDQFGEGGGGLQGERKSKPFLERAER